MAGVGGLGRRALLQLRATPGPGPVRGHGSHKALGDSYTGCCDKCMPV